MMKNRIAILLALISLPVLTKAQSPIGDGGTQLNFGAGLYSHGIPVYFGMDFGVHPDISLGFQTGLDLEFDYFTVAGRGDYHFNTVFDIPRDWDLYAGLSVGFAVSTHGHDHPPHHHHDHHHVSGLDLGLQIGGRYYWNRSWGINLEFGGGMLLSGGRFGLSKRF